MLMLRTKEDSRPPEGLLVFPGAASSTYIAAPQVMQVHQSSGCTVMVQMSIVLPASMGCAANLNAQVPAFG